MAWLMHAVECRVGGQGPSAGIFDFTNPRLAGMPFTAHRVAAVPAFLPLYM